MNLPRERGSESSRRRITIIGGASDGAEGTIVADDGQTIQIKLETGEQLVLEVASTGALEGPDRQVTYREIGS